MKLTKEEKNIIIRDIWCNQLNFIQNYNDNCKNLLDDIIKDLDKEKEIHKILDPFIGMVSNSNYNYKFNLFFISAKPKHIMYTFIDWHEFVNNKRIGGTRIDLSTINLSADIMKKINDYKSLLFKYCIFPKWKDDIMIKCLEKCKNLPELTGKQRSAEIGKLTDYATKKYKEKI